MTAVDTARTWACPDAEQVLRADADRDLWLKARREGVGGSDASTVAGVNPWASLYTLWLDKTGRAPEKPDTEAMEWGRRLEPVLRTWLADTLDLPVHRAGLMRHRLRTWQQVSLDGLTADGGIAEFKTTSSRTDDAHVWRDGQVPDHAECQVQHGLGVTGRSHAHCVVLIDGRTPLHQVIERDENLIAELTGLEHDFWHSYVLADVEPPVDGSSATTEAITARFPEAVHDTISAGTEVTELLTARATSRRIAADAGAEADEYDNRLRALFGQADQLAVRGLVVATLHQNGSFNPTRFAADNPGLADEYAITKPALDVDRLRNEHPELHTRYRARVLRVPANPKPLED